ncbi:hypothetical protein LINPERPRIM_LOCUS41039, partial [Linum perenne]
MWSNQDGSTIMEEVANTIHEEEQMFEVPNMIQEEEQGEEVPNTIDGEEQMDEVPNTIQVEEQEEEVRNTTEVEDLQRSNVEDLQNDMGEGDIEHEVSPRVMNKSFQFVLVRGRLFQGLWKRGMGNELH